MDNTYYPCLKLHRGDIRSLGLDDNTLSDNEMQAFADDIGESLMDLYWISIKALSEKHNLKQL